MSLEIVIFVTNYQPFVVDTLGGSDATQWTEMNIEETMAVLTRCSFDEQHRQPIFNLGGIPALAELIQVILSLTAGPPPVSRFIF